MPAFNEFCVLITGASDDDGRNPTEKFPIANARIPIREVRQDAVQTTLTKNPGINGSVGDE